MSTEHRWMEDQAEYTYTALDQMDRLRIAHRELREANAALIAACEVALSVLENYTIYEDVASILRAALAKARPSLRARG